MNLEALLYILNGLLLEKEIVLSPRLISKLLSIDSPISTFILQIAKIDYNFDFSFLDLSDEEGAVSFLKNRWDTDNLDGNFSSVKREKMKIGRLITALAAKENVEFSKKEIEIFVNKYKSQQVEQKFMLVSDEDIKKYYLEENYADKYLSSSLWNSCMRNDDCQSFFSVYCENPNVRLLILLDNDNKVLGRAIVWLNAIMDGKQVTYMDRIYASDSLIESFKNYAISKNWIFRVKQGTDNISYTDGKVIISNPKIIAEIPIMNWEVLKKPYMDTLCNLVESDESKEEYKIYLTNDTSERIEEWRSVQGLSDKLIGKSFLYNVLCPTLKKERIKKVYDILNTKEKLIINNILFYKCPECSGTGISDICSICDGTDKEECTNCDGTGRTFCQYCSEGYVKCSICDGTGKEECTNCEGSGQEICGECNGTTKIDCPKCDGEKEVECPECWGTGKNDDGSDCNKCEGSGKVECSDCDGIGEVDCTECEEGYVECDRCDGDGKIDCRNCDGDGNFRCEECGGDGMEECYDCDGSGRTVCGNCDGSGGEKCNRCDGDGLSKEPFNDIKDPNQLDLSFEKPKKVVKKKSNKKK